MVTVTLQFSMLFFHCRSAISSAPYGHCHSAVFIAPYRHCHFAPNRRSAVAMNVPDPLTSSRQNDAAASHSCNFNTVLYPRSYSQCQLPLNTSHCYIPVAASSVQN